MEQAVTELRPLAEWVIGHGDGKTAWVSNETAQRGPLRAEETIDLVLSQLIHPMRLHQAIELPLAEGTTEIVVLGPITPCITS